MLRTDFLLLVTINVSMQLTFSLHTEQMEYVSLDKMAVKSQSCTLVDWFLNCALTQIDQPKYDWKMQHDLCVTNPTNFLKVMLVSVVVIFLPSTSASFSHLSAFFKAILLPVKARSPNLPNASKLFFNFSWVAPSMLPKSAGISDCLTRTRERAEEWRETVVTSFQWKFTVEKILQYRKKMDFIFFVYKLCAPIFESLWQQLDVNQKLDTSMSEIKSSALYLSSS